MLDWFFQNWRSWLSNVGWWQAIAAIIQAGFAVLLFFVTRRYVRLTHTLARSALHQARLQQQALKISLFEKRLKVYLATMQFLAKAATTMKPTVQDAAQLLRETAEVDFLFEPNVAAFIQTIYQNATGLHAENTVLEDEHDPKKRAALLEKTTPLETWLVETAFAQSKALFGPYLSFKSVDWDQPAA